MSVSAVSPLLLQRYELKYLIPVGLVEPISKFIEGFCEMDYYSQISHDKFYMINSLYFDTPQFQFIQNKQAGVEPSFSLRVRSYGENPKPPYYSEIKLKMNDFSNKMRAKLDTENWAEALQAGVAPAGLEGRSRGYFERFVYLINAYNAGPRILTQYRRKAYLSQIDEYARVTFDRDLRFQLQEEFSLIPDERAMCHYDHEELFPHPEDNVILELKAEKKIPVWMIDLIKRFDLTRGSFSKYSSAISQTHCELDPPFDLQSPFSRVRSF